MDHHYRVARVVLSVEQYHCLIILYRLLKLFGARIKFFLQLGVLSVGEHFGYRFDLLKLALHLVSLVDARLDARYFARDGLGVGGAPETLFFHRFIEFS